MDVTIELLQEKDIPEASKFMRGVITDISYYNEEAKNSQKKLYEEDNIKKNLLRNDLHVYLVAKIDAKIVGFIDGWGGDAGVFWAGWIGVDKNVRGNNIAGKIIQKLEYYAKEKGHHKIWCDTRTENKEAISMIEKMGYNKVGLLKDYWHHLDFYLWDKSL